MRLLPAEEAADLVVIAQEGQHDFTSLDHVDDPECQAHPQFVRPSTDMFDAQPRRGVAGVEIVLKVLEG